jgi:hypothetical protein
LIEFLRPLKIIDLNFKKTRYFLLPWNLFSLSSDALFEYHMPHPGKAQYQYYHKADILQRHIDTIRRMCKQGTLEGARKIGHDWYIPCTTIDPPAPHQKPTTPQGKEPTV